MWKRRDGIVKTTSCVGKGVIAYLVTGVGTGEKDTRGLASESGGSTGLAKVRQSRDLISDSLLLAEAGLGDGHEGGDKQSLGKHYVYYCCNCSRMKVVAASRKEIWTLSVMSGKYCKSKQSVMSKKEGLDELK